MKLARTIPATVLAREKRFRLLTNIDGERHWCYLPNPGRLQELVFPGATVWVRSVDSAHRKLQWEAVLGYDGVLVSLHAALANALLVEAAHLLGIGGSWSREVVSGSSRFDFSFDGRLVEVKSVTLVQQGLGLFPDAPTTRGAKHMRELAEKGKGLVVFVVQRPDAEAVTFNAALDPDFAAAAMTAYRRGVEFRAFNCKVSLEEIEPWREIPVIIPQY
ncbi:DNA/RNA nuclease SfsA [Coprothermobacteraceae bacterium]|nr:DNA/RNA nuclease SfsA [Coprothermobacteraceae bacterium]